MTTAELHPASEVPVLRNQAGMVRDVMRLTVAGVTHEESLIRPQVAGNSMNWVMGHLLNAYDGTAQLLGQPAVMPRGALKQYERFAPPMEDDAKAIRFEELVKAWETVVQRVDDGLANVTTEKLNEPVPNSPTGNPKETVRTLLLSVVFHQAYHAGQTAMLRRIIGKERAIP